MDKWIERIKQRYWQESIYGSADGGFMHVGVHTPWPRRFWNEHRAEIKRGFWTMFFAVLGALIIKGLL